MGSEMRALHNSRPRHEETCARLQLSFDFEWLPEQINTFTLWRCVPFVRSRAINCDEHFSVELFIIMESLRSPSELRVLKMAE